MDPESTSPHSKAPVACPYPEPEKSTPRLLKPLLENSGIKCNIIK